MGIQGAKQEINVLSQIKLLRNRHFLENIFTQYMKIIFQPIIFKVLEQYRDLMTVDSAEGSYFEVY